MADKRDAKKETFKKRPLKINGSKDSDSHPNSNKRIQRPDLPFLKSTELQCLVTIKWNQYCLRIAAKMINWHGLTEKEMCSITSHLLSLTTNQLPASQPLWTTCVKVVWQSCNAAAAVGTVTPGAFMGPHDCHVHTSTQSAARIYREMSVTVSLKASGRD